ncbi:hypothetical protein FRC01_013034 [Tulasnella sp. 417]|nr:hypothetical protein FRC01_013034 [Tulasnella sp. 417]
MAFVTVDGMPANPPAEGPKPDSARQVVGPMTNSKRLSMGLPPLKPRALQRGSYPSSLGAPFGDFNVASHPVGLPPEQSNSSLLRFDLILRTTSHTCNILVKNAVDGSTRGYLAPTAGSNMWGCFDRFQEDQAGSLEVSFYSSPDDPSPHELDFFMENAPNPSEPYFSAGTIATHNSLESNWACIKGSATQTPPGWVPQMFYEDYQTAIWKYNLITQDITAEWIRPDGSSPPNQLSYSDAFGGIGLTVGPPADWFESHPITFTCVPPLPIEPVR